MSLQFVVSRGWWRSLLLGGLVGIASFMLMWWFVPARTTAHDPIRELDPYPDDPQLRHQVSAIDFDDAKFADVIAAFAKAEKLTIVCQWDSLHNTGVMPDALVSLHLRSMSVRKALDYIVAAAQSNFQTWPAWNDVDGVIIISPPDQLDHIGPVVLRSYDIRPLLAQSIKLDARFPPLSNWGGGFSSPSVPVVPGTTPVTPETEKASSICELLWNHVAADSWRNNGGEVGEISYFNGSLIIRQTETVHLRIGRFLDLLSQNH